jgi:hypothetical protein
MPKIAESYVVNLFMGIYAEYVLMIFVATNI